MNDTQFTFKYSGTSEIEVGVLIKSLENISKGLKDISKEANGQEVEVKIKPFKEGSFEWIVALSDPQIISSVSLLASNLTGDDIIEKFKTLIDIVTFFKGEKMKEGKHVEGDNYEFTNNQGEVKIIKGDAKINEFNNNGAVIYVENLILGAGQTVGIDGINLLDKNKNELINVSKTLLQQTSQNINRERTTVKETTKTILPKLRDDIKHNAHIAITKPDLAGKSLWKVVYEGYKIDVKIEDVDFLTDVNQGKYSFANGTLLLVDLILHQELDTKINAYTNKSYTVAKFHKFVTLPTQASLF